MLFSCSQAGFLIALIINVNLLSCAFVFLTCTRALRINRVTLVQLRAAVFVSSRLCVAVRCLWLASICAGKWGRGDFDVHFTGARSNLSRACVVVFIAVRGCVSLFLSFDTLTETVDHLARAFFSTSFTIVLLSWAQTIVGLYGLSQTAVRLIPMFLSANVVIYVDCFLTLVLYGLDAKSDTSTDPAAVRSMRSLAVCACD